MNLNRRHVQIRMLYVKYVELSVYGSVYECVYVVTYY